jgi:hypothetical protein
MRNELKNKFINGLNIKRTDILFVFLCLIFLYLHTFILPAYPIFIEGDHLYIVQDAWRMYLGEEIYKDFFQLMFPGTQVCYLFLFKIFGLKFWTINLMIILQGFSTVLILLAISRKIFSNIWYSYLTPSLYLFFGFRWFGLDGSHRMFSPIFAMLAVLVLLKSRTFSRIIIAGIFCALAGFFTQQRGFIAVGAIGIFLIFDQLANKKGWKDFLLKEISLGLSFSVTLILLILPFVLSSGLERFLDYTFFYISNYVQEPTANYSAYLIDVYKTLDMGLTAAVVMFFYLAIIPLIYFVVFIYLSLKRNDENVTFKLQILLIALMGGFLTLGTFAPNTNRYYQIAVPALILFVWMFYKLTNKTVQVVKLAVIGLVLFGLILAFRVQTNWETEILETRTGNIAFLSPVTIERYKWLAENADKNDTVFEVYLCAVNFPLLLKNPTQTTFLLNNGYTPEWMVLQSIESLESKKTRFVIWDAVWTEELKTKKEGEDLMPLYEYLQSKYYIRKNFTPNINRKMQLWERK